MSILRRLSWFFKQQWRRYAVGLLALVTVSLLQVAQPRIVGWLIDRIAQQQLTGHSLLFWLLVLLGIGLVQYGLRYVWRIQLFGGSYLLAKQLRQRLFAQFLRMDRSFYHTHRIGDLIAHATNDVTAVDAVAGSGVLMLADALFLGLVTLVMMFVTINWQLTLLALLPMPLMAVISRVLGSRVHQRFRAAQAAFSRLTDKTQESISGVKVIKTFGVAEADHADFQQHTQSVYDHNVAVHRMDALFGASLQLIIGLSYALTIFAGGFLVQAQQLTVGDLVAFMSYIAMMAWPLFSVGQLFNVLERGRASYQRIEALLALEPAVHEAAQPLQQPLAGAIHYQVHRFAYPETQHPALYDCDITIPEGTTLGVVGKTGSGKSTLVKLLLREYDHYQGSITYNQVPIQNYALDSLLSGIGYVPQDTFLFASSVRDNIAFAAIDASSSAIAAAAFTAAVTEDIERLPQGYDTLVGERGVSLSGGQKQRLAIARALLLDPELLILDDALSAVDAKTEALILQRLKATRQQRTTIIVAHRMSSVMHAEQIVVLDEGRIVARGTHEQLLEQGGWYADMYAKQQLEQRLAGGEQDG